jgi:hypothetical protein
MLKYFTFEEEVNDFLTALWKGMTQQKVTKGMPDSIKDRYKTCRVIDKEGLTGYVKEIIAGFEDVVLHREDETSVNEILDNEMFFYKFREGNFSKQGLYHIIRYLPSINCFDVYLQNNYLTFAI